MRQKIYSLDELAPKIRTFRSEGKIIAHCHGCFDLLHPGHLQHFEAARKNADILVVTLTPDRFVNKGPGRPVFNEQLRLQAIAAIEAVDYVALNKWETATETIRMLQPNYYVKGQDYKDMSADITKGIYEEAAAVEEAGGELLITEEIQFSSSKLINAHMSPYDESVNAYRENFKLKFNADSIIKELESLKDLKVLVIGDTIIDEYHYCQPLGKSTKSASISSKFIEGHSYAGGVLAIANHLQQFAGTVNLFTLLGADDSKKDLIENKLDSGIEPHYFYRKNSPTPTKRRYLDKYLNIKLFEVTFMNDTPMETALEEEIKTALDKVLDTVDVVVIADFGHGMITAGLVNHLEKKSKFLCVNAQTNSNNYGFNYITKYDRADFISIDENEIRLPFGDKFGAIPDLIKRLEKITHCSLIQVTLGQKGSVIYSQEKFYQSPALATAIKDSVGAGDAVLSITSLLAAKKNHPEIIGMVGNAMGSLAVEIIGNEHPVYKKDLLKFIKHFLK